MNTQYTEKELTGIIAQESAIKIFDEKEHIKTTILDAVRELEYEGTSTDKEAKFAINILVGEYFIQCTGRISINGYYEEETNSFIQESISLYDFEVGVNNDDGSDIAFTINGQTQYDFINDIVEEVDKW